MKKQNEYPVINKNDVIYTYKERVFSGFAPCFQYGLYSLACCKGAKDGSGMRQSVCRAVESGRNVWVLAIAAGDVKHEGNNTSPICYEPGDAIYLAKIDKVYTWKEYSTLSLFEERKDSYYVLRNGKVDWRKKIDGLHDDRDALEHDCALGLCCKKGVSEEDVFTNEKQILTSEEYYVFDKGQRLSGITKYKSLDVARGFSFMDKDNESRTAVLIAFLRENHSFYCKSGTDPFSNSKGTKGGSCR